MLWLFEQDLPEAITLLQKGSPILFPTETVYGLGAPLFHEAAVETLFLLKGRPKNKPLIVHIHSLEQVDQLAIQIPPLFYQWVTRAWPGPFTFVLRKRPGIAPLATAGGETIALRMPSHPLALRLLQTYGEPLVGTSANSSGQAPLNSPQQLIRQFDGRVAAFLHGAPEPRGIPSTVISLVEAEPKILRDARESVRNAG